MQTSMNQLIFPFYARTLRYTGYIHAGTHDMTQDVYVRSKFMYVLSECLNQGAFSLSHKSMHMQI